MNHNQPPPKSDPEFDRHRDGKRGLWIGATCGAVGIGLVWFLLT